MNVPAIVKIAIAACVGALAGALFIGGTGGALVLERLS